VKLGPSFLIFGSRSSSEGLFHEEIKEYQERGVLTEAFMCYSRDIRANKEYTDEKLRSTEVRGILGPILADPNTHIFMCGSANMAEDCKISLRDISSPDLFDSIVEGGRLHCDVFGALLPKSRYDSRRKSWNIGFYLNIGDDLTTGHPNLGEMTKLSNARRSHMMRRATIEVGTGDIKDWYPSGP
jgi:hypothetical protein